MSNTASLSRHYERLTPRERVSLLAAAWGREDQVETTAPDGFGAWRYFPASASLWLVGGTPPLTLMYVIQQLDLAACYWHTTSVAEQPLASQGRRTAACTKRLYRASRLLAYRAGIRAEAWKRFCAGLFVKPEDVVRHLPGYNTVHRFEELARFSAFSEDEAKQYLAEVRNDGDAPPPETSSMETADTVAASMQHCLEEACKRWE